MLSSNRITLAVVASLVVLAYTAPSSYATTGVQISPPEPVIQDVALPGGDPLPPPPPPPPPPQPPDEPDDAEIPGVAMPGGDPLPPPPPDPKL